MDSTLSTYALRFMVWSAIRHCGDEGLHSHWAPTTSAFLRALTYLAPHSRPSASSSCMQYTGEYESNLKVTLVHPGLQFAIPLQMDTYLRSVDAQTYVPLNGRSIYRCARSCWPACLRLGSFFSTGILPAVEYPRRIEIELGRPRTYYRYCLTAARSHNEARLSSSLHTGGNVSWSSRTPVSAGCLVIQCVGPGDCHSFSLLACAQLSALKMLAASIPAIPAGTIGRR
ncbi:hypothetical protein FA95DRAFT_332559 [Auriscalpium vulgare]|uniref:Uncharacterized protein n=1 Tax=Auriscalpium vulgare TaxID=40419 RepID=A0ACB8RI25_9AGAM|nr:hypothetical protein FA95DRAFT_332559 [Auriscalpium vulgare]